MVCGADSWLKLQVLNNLKLISAEEEEILNVASIVSIQAKRFQGDNLGPYNLNSAEVLQFGVVLPQGIIIH